MNTSATRAAEPEPLLATKDQRQARDIITDIYLPHDLKIRDGRSVDFRMRHLKSERLTVGHLVYGADAELIIPASSDCFHLNLPLRGTVMNTQAGQTTVTDARRSAVMFSPGESFSVRWSDSAMQYATQFPRRVLEDQLSRLVGRQLKEPLRFGFGVDLTGSNGQSLFSSLAFLMQEWHRPDGISAMPLARAQLEAFIVSQVLYSVPNSYSTVLATPTRPANRARIQKVIDVIEAHPERDLSIAELSTVAGVSARALQAGFKDETGMSPMSYVRMIRLERAHADLLAEAGSVAVTTIAMRWGFFHLGRFSQQYRARFGELPSDSVRQVLGISGDER